MAEFDPAADMREFIREMMLRFERTMASFEWRMVLFERTMIGFDRRLEALIDEMRRDRELAERRHEENRAELRDLREESRAQTKALLRVIDRLDNGGAAPAT
jgi:hypothetical protein